MFGGAVDCIDVIVAIVKEVAHFFPCGGADCGVFAAQGFIQRGETFVGLLVGSVQVEERTGQRGRVGGRKAQVGDGRGGGGEDGICKGLAHVGDQAFAFADGQLCHVKAELLRQGKDHGGADGPVVVLHLIEVGQGHREFLGEDLLGQRQAAPDFPQLDPGVEFLCGHLLPLFAKHTVALQISPVKLRSGGRGG